MTCIVRPSIPPLVLSIFLASCSVETHGVAQRNDVCAARGHQPNTDTFSDCVVRLESERELRIDTRRRELLEK
jgi:hypothetical protein